METGKIPKKGMQAKQPRRQARVLRLKLVGTRLKWHSIGWILISTSLILIGLSLILSPSLKPSNNLLRLILTCSILIGVSSIPSLPRPILELRVLSLLLLSEILGLPSWSLFPGELRLSSVGPILLLPGFSLRSLELILIPTTFTPQLQLLFPLQIPKIS